ncbi:MAG: trypsin-like peptidase domain-containing protein [Akkermansiaceae bacterium]|nr:trypsin-like peptidase domain-containing protein [Akkermansiaceae bacterium]
MSATKGEKRRRAISLLAVFLIAFGLATAVRYFQRGGSLTDLRERLGFQKQELPRSPEGYTLSGKAPLELDEVELLSRLNAEYARLTRAVVPSVVSINTERFHTARMRDLLGRTQLRRYSSTGQGSGVIVTHEGHVITNYHVIAGQQKISATLHGGKEVPATLIGEDQFLDIAVLKLEDEGPYQPLKFGDSSRVEVGQMVFAVGSPFGLGETVTQGIISAKERSLSDNQRDLFQTDAAINPGNSGGPLVNLRGEIIGINVAIFSPDKENPGFQGVGFSIPSNDARDSLEQILDRGRPVRGFLGVQMRDLDPYMRRVLRYRGEYGAVVIGVAPDSPAERAGLQPRDIIITYRGTEIRSYAQLFALVQATRVGETVDLRVWRDGREMEVTAEIAESVPPTVASTEPTRPQAEQVERVLHAIGLEVRELSVHERMRGHRGVVVTAVHEGGLAEGVLQRGDLIFAINGNRISGAVDFFMQLAGSALERETRLQLMRADEMVQAMLPQVED